MAQEKSAVVVGAGVSGLSCARSLLDRGWRVQVIDKARGVGGRLATRRVETVGNFDMGAQFITARDPRFIKLLEREQQQGRLALWSGTLVYQDGQETSRAKEEKRWVGVPSMNSWIKDLVPPEMVRLSHQVKSLTRQGDRGWGLDLGRDRVTEEFFDWVILALPSHQAAALIPEGIPLKGTCATAKMLPCWTVYVGVQGTTGIPFDGVFMRDPQSPLSWMANCHSKPGRITGGVQELWVLQASPQWTETFFETPSTQVESMLLDVFRAFCQSSHFQIVHVGSQRWRYASLPDETHPPQVLIDQKAQLAVAGDWTFAGRVEGAFLSGMRTGELVGQ